uniref:Cytoplasmic tRNA 2-thiolation protein 2 n=1 Tax=Tetraselmis sp. GSL018 TaxID=582737 RepID=A0A061RKW5_9CHLO
MFGHGIHPLSSALQVVGTARTKGLIEEGDTVLAAYSGGVGSTSMLHMLACMKSDVVGRKERNKVSFDLKAVFVDESAAYGLSGDEASAFRERMQAACAAAAGGLCQLTVVPLEDVFALDAPVSGQEQSQHLLQERLRELLEPIRDVTARQDLIYSLRSHLLHHVAEELRATKLAVGSSATRCAITTIEWCCKGRGFSLPAAIQYRDMRDGPGHAVSVLPVRDIGAKELALVCRFKRLPLVPFPLHPSPSQASKSIGSLSARFVANLQERLPSSVSTILGTSSKLVPFGFNALPEQLIGRRTAPAQGSGSLPLLCSLCRSPLSDREIGSAEAVKGGSSQPREVFCNSCSSSVLGPDQAVRDLLPEVVHRIPQRVAPSAPQGSESNGTAQARATDMLHDRISEFLLDN